MLINLKDAFSMHKLDSPCWVLGIGLASLQWFFIGFRAHQLTFTRLTAPYCGGACQWQKHFFTSSICDLKWFGTGKTWLLPRGWADGYSWTSGGRNSYFIGIIERPRTVGRCPLSLNIIKCFTIHPKPSHFQILRWLPDTSMKQEPIRQTDRGKLLSMKKHL